MGNICCCRCLAGETDFDSSESNIRTPLLGSQASNPQPPNPQSARLYNPRRDIQQFDNSIESLTISEMITVPDDSVDKKFKDQAKRYKDAVDAYRNLRSEIHNLKTYFEAETSGIPVLKECLRILAERLGNANIMIQRRSRTFIEVSYDPKDVSEKCKQPLMHYKSALKHVDDVLQHAPQIKENISIIINDEHEMLKNIAEVDLAGHGEAEGMRAITSNIKTLKQMNENMDDVQRRTEKTFKELIDASTPLCLNLR